MQQDVFGAVCSQQVVTSPDMRVSVMTMFQLRSVHDDITAAW